MPPFSSPGKKGACAAAFEALKVPDLDWVMLDSTVVRAHQYAAGQKSYTATECLGRSLGGMSTKNYVCTDALGNGGAPAGHRRLGRGLPAN